MSDSVRRRNKERLEEVFCGYNTSAVYFLCSAFLLCFCVLHRLIVTSSAVRRMHRVTLTAKYPLLFLYWLLGILLYKAI